MKKGLVSAFSVLCAVFTLTAAVCAANASYTFKGTNIAKPSGTEDVTNAELTKDITVTTAGDMNWKTAGVTDAAHNKDCGFYPIGDGFKPKGSYIFLATGSTNDNTVITLNLPEIAAGSRVALTYAKPVITNNGSTRRNENDPYAYFKIGDRYMSINGGEFDKFVTKSVVISEATNRIDFVCDKWGAAAIQKIEISSADASSLKKLTVKTERFANVTVNGIKLCADENGTVNAGAFEEGEEVTVTAKKDGYTDAQTVIKIGKEDAVCEISPECQVYSAHYESDFGVPSGVLTFDAENPKYNLNTPTKDVTKMFGEVTFKDSGNITVFAENDYPLVKIEKRADGIYANDKLVTAKDNMEFSVTFWRGRAILTQNDKDTVIYDGDMPEVSELSYIEGSGAAMDYIGVAYPEGAGITIDGPDTVTSAYHKLYDYNIIPKCPVPDAVIKWDVSGNDKVDISPYGSLSLNVPADIQGKVTLTAKYNNETATKEVTIVPFGKITDYKIGNTVMNLYENRRFGYVIQSVTSENGDEFSYVEDVCKLKDFKSSDESVIKIDETGLMTAVGKGKATISANAYTGVDNIISAEFTVDTFYLSGMVGEQAAYEENTFVENENITGYKIIMYDDLTEDVIEPMEIPAAVVDEDGTIIKARYYYFENELRLGNVETKPVKAGDKTEISTEFKHVYFAGKNGIKKITEATDAIEGFKIEREGLYKISPIYTFHNVGDVKDGKTLEADFPDELYNITLKKGETWRGDIYVNGYMVGNNVDQSDADRKLAEGALYTAEDIPVRDGKITVSMTDGSTLLDYVTVEETLRYGEHRIYIIGDSLACAYYGEFSKEVGGGRSGWGQQLHDFVNVPITNLANSGQFAAGLYNTAFPAVLEHAEIGDILLIECGYNDRNYSTREEMTRCVKSMIEECRKEAIFPVIVTPNASKHDYKESVVWSSYLRDIAIDMDCPIIDLSKMSYDFLYSLYGDDKDDVVTKNYNLTEVGGDTLHSSYAGAYVWASMVAQGLKDLGYEDWINTDFEYTFTDTIGNVITAKVK